MKQYRQGDVLVLQVSAIPKEARPASVLNKRIVLAEGEATGHAHAIQVRNQAVLAFMAAGVMYLHVKRRARLEHQEHGVIDLPAGVYQVRRQQEVWLDKVRNVAD